MFDTDKNLYLQYWRQCQRRFFLWDKIIGVLTGLSNAKGDLPKKWTEA
jgi:hypothetical protein